MNLNPEMYKRLIKMGQIFIVQEEKEKTMKSSSMDLESLQMDRKSLMKDAKHLGPLMVRGDKVHTWEKKRPFYLANIFIFSLPLKIPTLKTTTGSTTQILYNRTLK